MDEAELIILADLFTQSEMILITDMRSSIHIALQRKSPFRIIVIKHRISPNSSILYSSYQ